MGDRPERYYYYASERGCMKHPDVVDEIGVGREDGVKSCSLRIALTQLEHGGRPRFSMIASAHVDEWLVFAECKDILDLLSKKAIRSGEMTDAEPFYALRIHLEKLGYKNLGVLTT